MITLGQTKSDNINRLIRLTGYFYLVVFNKWDRVKCDHIKRLITITSDYIKLLSLNITICFSIFLIFRSFWLFKVSHFVINPFSTFFDLFEFNRSISDNIKRLSLDITRCFLIFLMFRSFLISHFVAICDITFFDLFRPFSTFFDLFRPFRPFRPFSTFFDAIEFNRSIMFSSLSSSSSN